MAGIVTDRVWKHSRAVNSSLVVLLAIAHEADRDGIAEMSMLELSGKTRLSKRSVQNAVDDLLSLGEIEVQSAGGGRGHRATYRVPRFEHLKGAESAPFEHSNGADSAPFNGGQDVTDNTQSAIMPGEDDRPEHLKGADSAPFAEPLKGAESAPFTPSPAPTDPLKGADPAPFTPSPTVVMPGEDDRPEHLKGADSAPLKTSDMFITTTGTEEVQVKDVPAVVQRDDVERLCRHLADRIQANGSRRPAVTRRWRDAARLMLDNDGRTEQQVTRAIDWCQDSEFWRANILSMPKLREKYDQLRLQATRANGKGNGGSTTDARVQAGLDLAAKYAQQERQELPA